MKFVLAIVALFMLAVPADACPRQVLSLSSGCYSQQVVAAPQVQYYSVPQAVVVQEYAAPQQLVVKQVVRQRVQRESLRDRLQLRDRFQLRSRERVVVKQQAVRQKVVRQRVILQQEAY